MLEEVEEGSGEAMASPQAELEAENGVVLAPLVPFDERGMEAWSENGRKKHDCRGSGKPSPR